MNLYFLVEGKETEPIVYRSWLKYLLPEIREVQGYQDVKSNNFLLRGARKKSPSFIDRLRASILEVNDIGDYDYLIICFDAEDRTVIETTTQILETVQRINDEDNIQIISRTKIELVIQNRCIETWFLGNRRIFPRAPQNPNLRSYIEHFNVYHDDPERMEKPRDDEQFGSHAQFHYEYLRLMFRERNLSYSKNHPHEVVEKHFLEQLRRRIDSTGHLNSLSIFFDLCERINKPRQIE